MKGIQSHMAVELGPWKANSGRLDVLAKELRSGECSDFARSLRDIRNEREGYLKVK
jgi:hypothetical protein